MVGYSGNAKEHSKKGITHPAGADKENQRNAANIQIASTPNNAVATKRKRPSSLTKTASRLSGLAKPKHVTTPFQARSAKTAPKTTPPRYTSIEVVDDPFRAVRDLPRTPTEGNDSVISPTSPMYRIDGNIDLIELGPSEESRFFSPIPLSAYLSPGSSPIKPFILPMTPAPSSPLVASSQTQESREVTSTQQPLDESHLSHLSDVSLGNTTPQKPTQAPRPQKSVSTFDLRASAGAGSVAATPKKVVVLHGGKRRHTFSPDLTMADMLHDLSFGTDASDEMPVAEDVAEVSKEEFLWSMKNGFEFLKHGRRGKPHKRMVWFDMDLCAICWVACGNKKKVNPKRTMKLHDIADILGGTITPVMLRNSPDPNLCFSIVGQKRTLDLECSTEQARDFWMSRFYLLKILRQELQH